MADRRSTRWDSHRAKVRKELVEAAFRAIDKLGPDVSMQEIAAEAGKPKPTLYRYFSDRDELFQAVGTLMKRMVANRVVVLPREDEAPTLREMFRLGLNGLAELLVAHPNVFHGFANSVPLSGKSSRFLEDARLLAGEIALTLALAMGRPDGPHENLDRLAATIVGAVFGANDWWIKGGTAKTSVEDHVEQLLVLLLGIVQASAQAEGFMIDFDAPLQLFAEAGSEGE